MLSELSIHDFAIIDQLQIQFDFGFNVLTGETGAGKSIILDSLTLVLGGRADSSMVRAGCDKAIIEATFELTPKLQENLGPLLAQHELEAEDGTTDYLWLTRELRANGRSLCRINGHSVSLNLLKEIGNHLVDIHGQGEHLSLLQPRAHLPLLDSYARLDTERQLLSKEVGKLRSIQKELAHLQQNAHTFAQRVSFLEFQLQEIQAANLRLGEEEELREERRRLANMEQLMHQASLTLILMEGMDDDTPTVLDLLRQIEKASSELAELDVSQNSWLEQLQNLVEQLVEMAREMRHYRESLEFDPERLAFLEERLELINRLKRKYGGDIAGILATRQSALQELSTISHSDERIHQLIHEETLLLQKIGRMAEQLSQKRQKAAQQLANIAEKELGELRMPGTRFQVAFSTSPDPNGAYVGDQRLVFDSSGIDQAEFLISTNPGEPLKPMAKVASGGETARLMLALKTALASVDTTPTLIFDEIDQGIGGRVGDTVGYKLWGLTRLGEHQVLVVTHLPQLAGYGDAHFQVQKEVNAGRTRTVVNHLDVPARLRELASMLGTGESDALNGAQSILTHVSQTKKTPNP